MTRTTTRRGLIATLAGLAGLGAVSRVSAQTLTGCEIQFVNGLLQVGGESCALLQPAGAEGAQISPPSTLAPPETSTSTTTVSSPQEVKAERRQRRRDHRRGKRGRRTGRQRDQRNRRRTGKKDARERRTIRRTTCERFDYQEEAQQWHDAHIDSLLIEDANGDVCPWLPSLFDEE